MLSTRLTMTNRPAIIVSETITADATRMEADINGRRWEVVCYRGDRIEVYREYSDAPGLMEFLGYFDEIAHTEAAAIVHPMCSEITAMHRHGKRGPEGGYSFAL